MANMPPTGSLLFDAPASYRVRVLGWLNSSWSHRLKGVTIDMDTSDEEAPICTLEGELPDQAALIGLLITLYELHLPLLTIECLSSQATNVGDL